MKKFLVFGFIFLGLSCSAQIKNISVHAGVNYPFIKSLENNNEIAALPVASATGYSHATLKIALKESFSEKVGFGIGAQFDYRIATRFFVTSGLSCHYLKFKRTVKITNFPSGIEILNVTNIGQPFGMIYANGNPDWNFLPAVFPLSEKYGNSTALSLHAPLLVGTSFFNERLRVRTGALFSYLLHATEVKSSYDISQNSITEYKDSSKEAFNTWQAGASIQTSYVFAQKIGIDFAAHGFFTPIYKSNNQHVGKAKYNVLSLGVSYFL